MQSVLSRLGQLVLSNVSGHLRSPVGVTSLVPSVQATASGPLAIQVRGIMRRFFPRPSNVRRIKRYSYVARLQTRGGRLILMRRLLKGRHCLAH